MDPLLQIAASDTVPNVAAGPAATEPVTNVVRINTFDISSSSEEE